MFDKAIIDTDRFMDLSMSSKALYFLLGMEADDEGFVSYKKVMRIHGGNEDDIKVLIAKSFLIAFDSGVVVITDWNSNNYLDKNRFKPTEYQAERKMLKLTEHAKYELNGCSTSIEEYRGEERSIEEKKEKPAKESYGELQSVKLTIEEHSKLVYRLGVEATDILIFELDTYIQSKGITRYKNHYATILSWAKRRHDEKSRRAISKGRGVAI